MLIALTSTGQDLSSPIDSRFGRTAYITIYDLSNSSFKAHSNLVNLNAPQGSGIQTAQHILELGANILITGNCGPKAFKVLNEGEVKVFNFSEGSVAEAINAFKENKLTQLIRPNVEGHW
jgi:predicted Fe-Mo cluster-binding NifX family protein